MSVGAEIIGGEPITLRLEGFGAGFGDRVVLADITLELGSNGLIALMGPTGVGKSTLLRILSGVAQQNASLKTWGEVRYLGLILGEAGWASLVAQDARLMVSTVHENLIAGLEDRDRLTLSEQRERIAGELRTLDCEGILEYAEVPVVELDLVEQRIVAILRRILGRPRLLCVDEPTSGLDQEASSRILELLGKWSQVGVVLMASHHQRQVSHYADSVALLAGGEIQEFRTAADFFTQPVSEAGNQFVNRGTCDTLVPGVPDEELDDDVTAPPLPEPARKAMSAWAGPRGFVWLDKGCLAGTPRPGVVGELSVDLDALARVGVTRLLTLLEEPLDCRSELASRGIRASHVPVEDMAAPTRTQAVGICRQIDDWLAKGEVVAVHCHAGHGRTGTALAAYRIWRGATALDAVEDVRRYESRWIQSRAQVDFLEEFESFVRLEHGQ